MLDINLIRSNPEYVKEALKKREYDVDFTEMLAWDARRKELLMENENLKAERNRMNKEIPILKKQGKDVSEVLNTLKTLSLIHICPAFVGGRRAGGDAGLGRGIGHAVKAVLPYGRLAIFALCPAGIQRLSTFGTKHLFYPPLGAELEIRDIYIHSRSIIEHTQLQVKAANMTIRVQNTKNFPRRSGHGKRALKNRFNYRGTGGSQLGQAPRPSAMASATVNSRPLD